MKEESSVLAMSHLISLLRDPNGFSAERGDDTHIAPKSPFDGRKFIPAPKCAGEGGRCVGKRGGLKVCLFFLFCLINCWSSVVASVVLPTVVQSPLFFCCVDNHLLVQDLYSMSPEGFFFFFFFFLFLLLCLFFALYFAVQN